jgi:hypothetical protein
MSTTPTASHPLHKAVLFGASSLGHYAASVLSREYDIVAFVDNDAGKWGTTFAGKPVHAPGDLPTLLEGGATLIITSSHHGAIANQLRELGHHEFHRFSARHQLQPVGTTTASAPAGAPAPAVADDFIKRINTVRTHFGETLRNLHRLGHRPSTVIDVGVAFGTPELTDALPEGDLIMIEPL